MKGIHREVASLVVLVFLLVSCGPSKLFVSVETSDPSLKASLVQAVKDFQASQPLGLALETVDVGFSFPSKDSPVVHLGFRSVAPTQRSEANLVLSPLDFPTKNAIVLMAPLENWAKEPLGQWQSVPILWDVLAVSNNHFTQPVFWGDLEKTNPLKGSLVIAGDTPVARQALFALSLLDKKKSSLLGSLLEGRTTFQDSELKPLYQDFLSWPRHPLFLPNSIHFGEADLANLIATSDMAYLNFVQTYQTHARSQNTQGMKLIYVGDKTEYSILGTLFVGYYTGGQASSDRAFAFLAYLDSPDVQAKLARETKMLPANLQTARMDSLHAEMEAAALRASQFIALNPNPVGEPRVKLLDDTLRLMLGNPDRWEAQLPVE